ncbi:MAG TPA: L-aspartate oxidase, partial [Candidatus Sericytochromatia bacterium]
LHLQPAQNVYFPSEKANTELKTWGETRNLLDVALLILKSATFRQESRGGHYRIDFPHPDTVWQVHTLVQKNHISKSSPTETELC